MPGSPPLRDGYPAVDVSSIHHPLGLRPPYLQVIQAQSMVVASATRCRSRRVACLERRKLLVIPAGQP